MIVNSTSFTMPTSSKIGGTRQLAEPPQYIPPEVQARRAGMTDEELIQDDYRRHVGEVAAWSSAGAAFATLHDGLKKIDKILAIIDPEISGNNWDFALNDGKLVAGGDLTEKERDLVETFLNAMPGMTEAVQSLEKSAFNALDVNGNGSRPSYLTNGYTGKYGLNIYRDVAGQLNGKLNIRELLSETYKYATHNGTSSFTGGDANVDWGRHATHVIESHLMKIRPDFDPPAQPHNT